jgi:anti-sigma B factor antagonist
VPGDADAPPPGGSPVPPRERPPRKVSELAVSLERRGEVVVVKLAGNLDIYTVPTLRSRVAGAARAETPLVLDLRRVELLDSSGLGALIALRNRAVAGGCRLALVSEAGRLRDVLVIAGLDRAFVHAGDVDTACSLVRAAKRLAGAGPAAPTPRSGR